jgi:hypothetical protein
LRHLLSSQKLDRRRFSRKKIECGAGRKTNARKSPQGAPLRGALQASGPNFISRFYEARRREACKPRTGKPIRGERR